MKKVIASVLTVAFLFSLSLGVFADPSGETKAKKVDPKIQELRNEIKAIKEERKIELKAIKQKKEDLKPLLEELKKLNEERQEQIEQAKEKTELIKQLIADAKESGSKTKIEAAKVYKAQLEIINDEIKALLDEKNDVRIDMKAAKGNKDFELFKADLIKVIDYKKSIIQKVDAKLALMDKIIAALK